MSMLYGADDPSGAGYTAPSRVNFGWLGESWKLFGENPFVWIPAILIAVYLPLMIDAIIFTIWSTVRVNVLNMHVFSPLSAIHHQPSLFVGLLIFNVVWGAWMWGGLNRTAVKQVTGQEVRLSDIFSGGACFANMALYGLLYSVIMSAATALLLLPALYIGGLLIAAFPLIASGESVLGAISRSTKAIGNERIPAALLAFVAGAMVALSWFVFLIGPLMTLPMYILISALAYRDLIHIPGQTYVEQSIDEIIPSDATTIAVLDGPRIGLSGEPVEEQSDAYAPPK